MNVTLLLISPGPPVLVKTRMKTNRKKSTDTVNRRIPATRGQRVESQARTKNGEASNGCRSKASHPDHSEPQIADDGEDEPDGTEGDENSGSGLLRSPVSQKRAEEPCEPEKRQEECGKFLRILYRALARMEEGDKGKGHQPDYQESVVAGAMCGLPLELVLVA